VSSLAILNLPLRQKIPGVSRLLTLCWNKDEPYSVRIISAPYGNPISTDDYKVEFAGLPDALHHCAHIAKIEENGHFYEDCARSQREHKRGWIHRNPRKIEAMPVHTF
jgi:hypothetical protein